MGGASRHVLRTKADRQARPSPSRCACRCEVLELLVDGGDVLSREIETPASALTPWAPWQLQRRRAWRRALSPRLTKRRAWPRSRDVGSGHAGVRIPEGSRTGRPTARQIASRVRGRARFGWRPRGQPAKPPAATTSRTIVPAIHVANRGSRARRSSRPHAIGHAAARHHEGLHDRIAIIGDRQGDDQKRPHAEPVE